MSGEKKRLEQYLLQTRASNVLKVDPRYARLLQENQPATINRMRLLQSQIMAGKVPVSEELKKQQKKKKKKSRRTKQLRGDLAQNLQAQRRFVKGERRDKDTEEPRIVGDPKPVPVGAAYDPDIERRRLDIQQAVIDQNRLDRIADRVETRRRQEAELAVRRGELAAGRAERALIRAAIPPPVPPAAPIVIPPPAVNVAAPRVEVAAPRVDVAPVINVPPALPARADADPIPEIQRLSAQIRADTDAFGQAQDERNRQVLAEVRDQIELQDRQRREADEAGEARQQAQDENLRQELLRNDARFQQIEERLGAGERALGDGRDEVLREIRAAEERLTGAQRDLDLPTNYDDVILQQVDAAVREGLQEGTPRSLRLEEAVTPTPGTRFQEVTPVPETRSPPLARPNTPEGLEEQVEVVAGGGELNLPPVLVGGSSEQQEQERRLRLSPEEQRRVYPRGTAGRGGTGRPQPRRGSRVAAEIVGDVVAGAEERLDLPETPPDPAEVLRLSRLALDESAPSLLQEEAEEAEAQEGQPALGPSAEARLRLTTTQDFLSGFQRPLTPEPAGTAASDSPSLAAARSAQLVTSRTRPQTAGPVVDELDVGDEVQYVDRTGETVQGTIRNVDRTIGISGVATEEERERARQQDIQGGATVELELPGGAVRDTVLSRVEPIQQELGEVIDSQQERLRDSQQLYDSSFSDLTSQVRPGPRGRRGERGGLGFRLRNNTDKPLKRVQPGDVVNVTGVEQGPAGRGVYRLDTQTGAGGRQTGSRVGLDQLGPLVQDGSFLFEKGHRHELGGHFDREPYGPPPEEPGLLQQGAEAAGGAAAAVVGGAGRLAGGLALGAAQGVAEQLPTAGDVGAAIGRGAVGAVSGAARLAGGAVGALVGGGEGEVEAPQPTLSSDE